MGKTRIQVSEETRDALKLLGNKGQSYNDIIQEIIAEKKFWKSLDRFKDKLNKMEQLEEAGIEDASGDISRFFNEDGKIKYKYLEEVEE